MNPIAPRERLTTLDLSRASTLALGGFVNHRKPIALLRALADAQPNWQPQRLVCFSGSVDLDLALALWPSIVELHCPFQGIEGITAISPLVRSHLIAQTLQAPPWDTGLLCLALQTPHGEVSLTPTGVGTDLPQLNPFLQMQQHQVAVKSMRVDLALLHVPAVDAAGDLWYEDSPWGDGLLLQQATQVIATVGALREVAGAAHRYPAMSNRLLLQLPRATGPTADPPTVAADPARLRQATAVAADDLTGANLRQWWFDSETQSDL